MAVTQIKVLKLGAKPPIIEFEGESTDTKPTYGGANSKFTELDTGKKFYFNGTEWKALAASEGGSDGGSDGGGSASVEQFFITFTITPDQEDESEFSATADKTYAEVTEAYDNGALLVANVAVDDFEAASVGLSGKYYAGDDDGEPIYKFIFAFDWDGADASVILDPEGATLEIKEAAQPSGGDEPLVVTMEMDAQTRNFVGDKTFAEVYEAYTGGQRVLFSADIDDPSLLMQTDLMGVVKFGDQYTAGIYIGSGIADVEWADEDLNNYFTFSLN